ncbi:MAG: beta-galactosidase, partial [Sphingobacteriaceae bacterium]
MKPYLCVLLLVIINLISEQSVTAQISGNKPVQERLSFDRGWKFHLGDIPFPEIKTHEESYNSAKAGNANGAASPDYIDRAWRTLNLPHDWVVEGEYDSTENIGQSYRKRGYGWYRRQFKLDTTDCGKYLEVQFDGIATHATVWVNGTLMHRSWSGSSSFYIDISAIAKYGDEINTIAVRVDANAMEGWWYEGAGIYRHVWLVKRSPVHIITDGVFANPVKDKKGNWVVPVEVTVENSGKADADVEVEAFVTDKSGKLINHSSAQSRVAVLGRKVANLMLTVDHPTLWSVDTPALYRVIVKVKQSGIVTDTLLTKCGFRTVRFDSEKGLFLNGQPLKIQGVCNHQDHAGVGVAVPDALWEFRLRKLKEMGVNGYRCAHNPPAVELLDACDSLGMLVMDENRNFNASPEYVRQLEWMVRRDRNHPSIILWSVFNEEPM